MRLTQAQLLFIETHMEKTIRKNGKWAKVSGKRGAWTVAKGWVGSLQAQQMQSWPTKDCAMVAANYWVND